nr:malate dehydrogenase, cytoplasmic [Quercus suber]
MVGEDVLTTRTTRTATCAWRGRACAMMMLLSIEKRSSRGIFVISLRDHSAASEVQARVDSACGFLFSAGTGLVVAGAAGGIGQPLSLLLKASPFVDHLSLYDVVNTPGVTADLSHISSVAKIEGFLPADDGLRKAFTGADIVIIPAGVPRKCFSLGAAGVDSWVGDVLECRFGRMHRWRGGSKARGGTGRCVRRGGRYRAKRTLTRPGATGKPGMTRDDLFKINAGIVKNTIQGVADYCPDAFILVISNPVNSTVPIAAEVMQAAGKFNPKKLFGVTTLDVVRAETFVQGITGERDPAKTVIPVIGGHSGETIVPLFSQAKPSVSIPADKLDDLTKRVQFGGDEVVKAKDGAGSATLSMAYAGFRFAEKVIRAAFKGETGIVEPTFVYLPGVTGGDAVQKETGLDFFSVPIELGTEGAKQAFNVVKDANDYEKKLLQVAYDGLKGNIAKGVEFVKNPPQK